MNKHAAVSVTSTHHILHKVAHHPHTTHKTHTHRNASTCVVLCCLAGSTALLRLSLQTSSEWRREGGDEVEGGMEKKMWGRGSKIGKRKGKSKKSVGESKGRGGKRREKQSEHG